MNEPPLRWGVEALWEQLTPLLPGLSVEVVARISSTNTALLERARVSAPGSGPDDGGQVQFRRSVESAAFGRRAADLQPCLLVAEHRMADKLAWLADPAAFYAGLEAQFPYPFIAKPADDGCSSAVKKIKTRAELEAFTELIFRAQEDLLPDPAEVPLEGTNL